ncbi:MAG: aminotransferase class V-fold PLP-dependent enzyme [Chloroflexi bacterium]|nr:aminotransferase class V-fold PLP-dependent enzyme [Chloroflexota bacterium]
MRSQQAAAFAELERAVEIALKTYSNVHRGSGHNSMVTTHLYEQARGIVLDYLGLDNGQYEVIFCTPRRSEMLKAHLTHDRYHCLSSQEIGLPLGVRALAFRRRALPRGIPIQTGGGTARLVSPRGVIWSRSPDKFEAGTPAIVNIIAFARALQLIRRNGNAVFGDATTEQRPVAAILYHDELEDYAGRDLLEELKKMLIGRGVQVPTAAGERTYINLDNGASTPTFTPIWNAVRQAWHQAEPVQQAIIHEVKAICSGFLGASLTNYDLLFTSNTTEAINLVAESLRNESELGTKPVILNSLLEHNSNELPWRMIPGCSLIRLPVDAEGFIDPGELEACLRAYNELEQHGKQRIKLVAVSGASNVLGVFNDLAEISRIAHRYGAQVLVDAAQLVAHRPTEMEQWEIDYLAFSAHKAYAPFGSGVLVARKGLLDFGSDELADIQSSGEENVGGIAALGKALVLLQRIGLDVIQEEEQVLTEQALRGLARIPGITIYGIKDPNSARFAQKGGVIVFSVENLMADRVAKKLAEQGGIGVRAGCHCAHLLVKYVLNIPPALERLQSVILSIFPQVALPGVARVSLGIENNQEDIDALIHVLGNIAQQPRSGADGRFTSTSLQAQMDDFVRTVTESVYSPLK